SSGSFFSSPGWKRVFSSRTTSAGPALAMASAAASPTQSAPNTTLRPRLASSAGMMRDRLISGTTLPFGRSKCASSTALPPRAMMSSTVGLILSIRVVSVTVAPSIGTLMSTRASTTFPAMAISSSVFQPIVASPCSSGRRFDRSRPPASTDHGLLPFPLRHPAATFPADMTSGGRRMADIKDPENTIIMTLKDGEVVIQLLPDVAPKHVERMKQLARDKAYDGVAFHRVIDGFMAQTGDVENANMDSPNYN